MPRMLLLLLLLLAVPPCHAQDVVHHCVSADGTPVFTDQPCTSMDAHKLGIAPSLPHHACPATRKALHERVAAAFAAHDANALAGLMLWDGFGDAEAVQQIAQFRRLMQRPLLDISEGPPPMTMQPAAAASSAPPLLASLVITLGGAGTQGEAPVRFAMQARAGCLWLLP